MHGDNERQVNKDGAIQIGISRQTCTKIHIIMHSIRDRDKVR